MSSVASQDGEELRLENLSTEKLQKKIAGEGKTAEKTEENCGQICL